MLPTTAAHAEPLFSAAKVLGDVSKFARGKESRAYAMCRVTDSGNTAGWVVIGKFGSLSEPLRYAQSVVFESKERAGELIWELLDADWKEHQKLVESRAEAGDTSDASDQDEVDARSISDIASDDTDEIYASAFDSGDIETFDCEVEDACAHAVCPIENEIGCRGWAVISAKGHSWEGISCWLDDVFATKEAAFSLRSSLLDADQEEWDEENREEEEEEEEESEDNEDEGESESDTAP